MSRFFTPLFPALFLATTLAGLAPSAQAQRPNGPDAAAMIERIMQADANGDGQITRAELIAYRTQQFARLDRNGDGFIDQNDMPRLMAGHFEQRMKLLVTQFDANHDGRISRDEFINGPTIGFDMADANHDGVATQAELRTALARAKAMARRGQ